MHENGVGSVDGLVPIGNFRSTHWFAFASEQNRNTASNNIQNPPRKTGSMDTSSAGHFGQSKTGDVAICCAKVPAFGVLLSLDVL